MSMALASLDLVLLTLTFVVASITFVSGTTNVMQGAVHLVVFAAYFLWCWLRGGQTLAMKAWRVRLVDVTPGKAILRFVLAVARSVSWRSDMA